MIETCWFYRCPKSECNCVGITNNVVLEHRYSDGVVPCPKCGQQMERIREALSGEYDLEAQEEIARLAIPMKPTFAYSSEAEHNFYAAMYGFSYPYYPNSPSNNAESPVDGDPASTSSENLNFLTEIDVAHMLGAPIKMVRQLVKKGKLRSIKLGKRKQVFTRALVEEFIQREAGLSPASGICRQAAGQFRPTNRPISLEESRSLLKDLRKNNLEPDEECRSVPARTRS
ncbi:MAG TPA: helix-turn-helix domain-containing protein [Desulfomonilaceae bacterium]|nr:helix-turn-helix domain-containing protein [Desulfomonilaceae bacterium]